MGGGACRSIEAPALWPTSADFCCLTLLAGGGLEYLALAGARRELAVCRGLGAGCAADPRLWRQVGPVLADWAVLAGLDRLDRCWLTGLGWAGLGCWAGRARPLLG